jgi:hypothetical protein
MDENELDKVLVITSRQQMRLTAACAALQGLLASDTGGTMPAEAAELAVDYGDRLLAELDKPDR